MAPKKVVAEPSKKSNKFRLVVFEGDFSDGSVSEIAQALTSALRPSTPPLVRQLSNGKPTALVIPPDLDAEDPADEEEQTIEADEAGDVDEASRPAEKQTKALRVRRSKPPEYLHDLISDSTAAKSFAADKNPSSKTKQYLTAMFWLKEVNSTPTVNIDKIYTFYKTVGWSVGFNDWNQPFHNLVHEDLIRKGQVKGEYAINPTGEDVVKSLPE